MATRTVRMIGDEILRKVSRPVEEITPRITELIEDMFETMYDAGGVGLAAPQVGILKRIVVIDCTPDPPEGEEIAEEDMMCYAMINPEILSSDGEQTGYEGCLSYVGMSGIVTRPDHVIVQFTDEDGEEQVLECTGLLARAVCHELDHLDGIMYVEKVEGEVLSNEEISRREQEQENGKGDSE